MFLCGFCPHELFVNTKADIGSCDLIHDETLRHEYIKSSKYQCLGYEIEFANKLKKIRHDLDLTIRKREAKLSQNSDAEATQTAAAPLLEKISCLQEHIDEKSKYANELGEQGLIEEACKVMQEISKIEEEKDNQEHLILTLQNESQKSSRICDVCGAFLIKNDPQHRLEEHLKGKLHSGAYAIREYIKSFDSKSDVFYQNLNEKSRSGKPHRKADEPLEAGELRRSVSAERDSRRRNKSRERSLRQRSRSRENYDDRRSSSNRHRSSRNSPGSDHDRHYKESRRHRDDYDDRSSHSSRRDRRDSRERYSRRNSNHDSYRDRSSNRETSREEQQRRGRSGSRYDEGSKYESRYGGQRKGRDGRNSSSDRPARSGENGRANESSEHQNYTPRYSNYPAHGTNAAKTDNGTEKSDSNRVEESQISNNNKSENLNSSVEPTTSKVRDEGNIYESYMNEKEKDRVDNQMRQKEDLARLKKASNSHESSKPIKPLPDQNLDWDADAKDSGAINMMDD